MLAEHPQLESSRHDMRPGLRYFSVGEYVILYRITDKGVEIMRVEPHSA